MEIDEVLSRGVAEVIQKDSLVEKLKSGKKLKIKLGVDPTAPDLHLGHVVVLRKLKEFQELGHGIIFLIGDYTAKIGDPSGRNKTRPILSDAEIEENTRTYLNQVGKILKEEVTVTKNSEWFEKMSSLDFLKLASQMTVSSIIERDDFNGRLKKGSEVYLHEIFYPVMQAYDSVMLKADVELGGSDQKFNLLAGRELMKKMNLPPQDIITMPLLIGTDGKQKMSKSLGNYIAINDSPADMYGKVMSIPDELIVSYYELVTDITIEGLEVVKKELADGKNPRDVKAQLAYLIVEEYHTSEAAEKAQAEFDRVYKNKELPVEMTAIESAHDEMRADKLLVELSIASSSSGAKRLIEQGAVTIDNEKISDPFETIQIKDGMVVKAGRKFAKVKK